MTGRFLEYATDIAERTQAAAIFIYADAVPGKRLEFESEFSDKIWWITKTREETKEEEATGHRVLQVPNVSLTRIGQIKLAVFNALTKGVLRPTDSIVCLSGVDSSGMLDTLIVMNVGEEFEIFSSPTAREAFSDEFDSAVLERTIEIAISLGAEGREGKPVGTIFVVGDGDSCALSFRRANIDPFRGYPSDERNIVDPKLEETVKELATIDGAFVIDGDGTIQAAGIYLKSGSSTAEALPHGLGARHHAAAAITNITKAIAVCVSESTGTVSIFRSGKLLTQIEKPRQRAIQR